MSKIGQSGYTLLDHTGKSIYASAKPDNIISSFCLLNKTISSIFCQQQNLEFNFETMKKLDKLNIEKLKFNSINEHSSYNLRRKNFLENTFYEDVLKNKENFENTHKDTNFRMLQNEDKSNSALYYHINIINNLYKSGELARIKKQMEEKLNNISEYEKENCSIISDEFICRETGKNNYYKRVKGNGNSFYISFAYQYIKYLVQKGEESLISEIFYIMDKELIKMNQNKNKNKNNIIKEENLGEKYISTSIKNNELIDLMKMFNFFSLIYNNMVEKNIEEAEKMLEYAFKYEESFGNFFTLFMKLQIKHFIAINKDIFTYEKYCENEKLIEEKYFKDGIFLYEDYVNNNLFMNQIEPTLFIITLVPYVFNVSMNLYIKEKNFSFEKITFDLLENSQTNISILYSTYSYHIIENSLINNNTLKDFDIVNTLGLEKSYFKYFNKNDYITVEEKKCDTCNNHKFIRFEKKLKIINSSICLNCLINTINEILMKRYEKMIAESFKYLEFYLRDIPLALSRDNNFIFLSPPEFYCLFESNMYTYFRKLIMKICDGCRKLKKNIIIKDCGCKRCLNCAKKEIKNDLALTNFEKKYILKGKYITCQCNKKNSIIEYSKIIYDSLDEEEKKKLEKDINLKIQEQIKSYCMFCRTQLKNQNSIGGENLISKFIKVKFKGQLTEHCICTNCKGKENLSDICNICEQKHEKEKDEKKEIDGREQNPNNQKEKKLENKDDNKIIKNNTNKKNIKNSNNNKSSSEKKSYEKEKEKVKEKKKEKVDGNNIIKDANGRREEDIICKCIIF